MAAYRLAIASLDLVAAYEADLWDVGQRPDHKVLWGARYFCARIGEPSAFNALPLDEQLGVNTAVHRFVTWLIATRRLRPSADYLVARRPRLGITLSRHWPGFFAAFMTVAAELGFGVKIAQAQWAMLGQICALLGLAPERLSHADLDDARDALLIAADRHGQGTRKGISTAIFGLEATLFHAGVTDELPRKRACTKADVREAAWARVPPTMRATMQSYLEQLATTLRPGRVKNVEATLREFAGFITEHDPDARCVADLGRRHIEDYKRWLAERPAARVSPCIGTPFGTGSARYVGSLPGCWNGRSPTLRVGFPCSHRTCRSPTRYCPASSTTGPRPSCCRPRAPTKTRLCA